MLQLRRTVVFYDWPERISGQGAVRLLTGLWEAAHARPTVASLLDSAGKVQRKIRLAARDSIEELTDGFESYPNVAFDAPLRGRFTDSPSHLSLRRGVKMCSLSVTNVVEEFSHSDATSVIGVMAKETTPAYGFSLTAAGLDGILLAAGMSTGRDMDAARKASRLRVGLTRSKSDVSSKLHDVYEMNVLTSRHLVTKIFKKSLGEWIRQEGYGDLVNIKTDLFVWIVPDVLRHDARVILDKANVIIAD